MDNVYVLYGIPFILGLWIGICSGAYIKSRIGWCENMEDNTVQIAINSTWNLTYDLVRDLSIALPYYWIAHSLHKPITDLICNSIYTPINAVIKEDYDG